MWEELQAFDQKDLCTLHDDRKRLLYFSVIHLNMLIMSIGKTRRFRIEDARIFSIPLKAVRPSTEQGTVVSVPRATAKTYIVRNGSYACQGHVCSNQYERWNCKE